MTKRWRLGRVGGGMCLVCLLSAQMGAVEPPAEPEIVSVFPAGGGKGARLEISIQGTGLEGVYAAWFDTERLRGTVGNVEPIELVETAGAGPRKELEKFPGHRVSLSVEVDPTAKAGRHSVWLVSPRGVSNALAFLVHSAPVVIETESPNGTPADAQQVTFPAVISGKIDEEGEVDFYSFEVPKNQELRVEAFTRTGQDPNFRTGNGFDAHLTLYESGKSWFDPNRLYRLANSYHPAPLKTLTTLNYRFSKSGRYLLRIGAFLGIIGPGYSYQLLIAPADGSSVLKEQERDSEWDERAFPRTLEQDRLAELVSRTVVTSETGDTVSKKSGSGPPGSGGEAPGGPSVDSLGIPPRPIITATEVEPNDTRAEALQLTLPATIEGTIERPGDVDYFRFRVKREQGLAFEVETPDSPPPYFNPRLGIFEHDGEEELFTNIHKFIAGDGDDWIKRIEPKTIYMFQREGEYVLQVRDMTSRQGDSSFRYRILIRPQIPHMGKIVVTEDRVNLRAGGAKKLTLTAEQEEGYNGDIAFAVENLPVGVEALAAVEVEPESHPPLDEGFKERYLPKSQTAAILLVAGADAQVMRMPRLIRVIARPVVRGELGVPTLVGEIPLMVVAESSGAKGD